MPKREIHCEHKLPISECQTCYPVFLRETTVGQALDDLEPSEYDRQMAIFAEKIKNPDQIIVACSVVRAEYPDGEMYHFLTVDDKLIRITTRDEDKPE